MSSALSKICLVVLCSCGGFPLHAEVQVQKPLRDPFERPQRLAVKPASDERDSYTVAVAVREADWKPELRAIMVAGDRSLVNIGGRILGIGESTAGYTLVKVEERSAVLIKDGVRLNVILDREKTK